MENTNEPQAGSTGPGPMSQQAVLPNSTAVLVLGIISIAACWCYGLIGMVLGIIALALAGKPRKLYAESPELYSLSSYNNLKAGRVCAIIGVSLSSLVILFYIIYFAIMGAALGTIFSSMPWETFID